MGSALLCSGAFLLCSLQLHDANAIRDLSQHSASVCHNCGFYPSYQNSVFYKLALKSGTDKVTQGRDSGHAGHSYEGLYTKVGCPLTRFPTHASRRLRCVHCMRSLPPTLSLKSRPMAMPSLSLPLSQYFEGNPRHLVSRMLEIGLGCTMTYGPGASSKLWRWYFPQVRTISDTVL